MAKFPTLEQIMAMPLRQQAQADAERRHRYRLQELKQMGAALALLEPEHAAIKAAGYTIHPDAISPVFRERLTLRITGSVFDGDFRLCKALLLAGFVIIGRDEGSYRTVHFKKGRLTICVIISAQDLARLEPAAAQPATETATETTPEATEATLAPPPSESLRISSPPELPASQPGMPTGPETTHAAGMQFLLHQDHPSADRESRARTATLPISNPDP